MLGNTKHLTGESRRPFVVFVEVGNILILIELKIGILEFYGFCLQNSALMVYALCSNPSIDLLN